MLAIVAAVVSKLKPGGAGPITLDASLDRDLGLDSLARVELASRIEAAFGTALDEDVLATAERVRDLLNAVLAAQGAPPRGAVSPLGAAAVAAGFAIGHAVPPAEVATLDRRSRLACRGPSRSTASAALCRRR